MQKINTGSFFLLTKYIVPYFLTLFLKVKIHLLKKQNDLKHKVVF